MTDTILKKPDYEKNACKDVWSIKDFAMLLHDVCPDTYKSLRLENDATTPSGFEEIRSTYVMLKAIKWKDKYKIFHTRNGGNHPLAFIHEAKIKGIPLSAALWSSIEKRHQQEMGEILKAVEGKDSKLITRERNNLLKGIGILISVLRDEKAKASRNLELKLSALQITRLMMDKAENLGVDVEGIKSFDRKIAEAIDLINQEADKKIIL